ncbi:MAG: divalent-cation tolerance protein CutA [candidate division WOR-3 bacterium]|uniref:Divalent-cation tolerance protein CutA n=1 Tax=candidate division WOR-3 bacterium TaxID=2052148 RepID=A0A7V4CHV9_UNCW3
MSYVILYTTIDNLNIGKKIVKKLLEERLIACANIFKISSYYWWKGKIEKGKEYGIFLKTKKEKYKEIEKRIKELHPYETPCLLQLEIKKGYKKYLSWLEKEIK